MIARLRSGSDAAAVTKEVGAIAKRIHDQYRDVTAVDAVAIPLQDQMTKSVRVALPVLLAAVGMLLLVACANVTNLLLAHIASRNRELAVRTALGASRGAVARLFLSQSLTLTAIGGFLGVLASQFAVDGLLAMSDRTLPRIDEIRPDFWVLSFAVLISLTVGLVLGLVPVFRVRRMNLDDTLKQGGRAQTQGTASRTVRSTLVIAQVAMTIILLVGAGLLGRSFVQLLTINLGFQTENRFAVEMLGIRPEPVPEDAKQMALQLARIIERTAGMPGVAAVGGASQMPLAGRYRNGRFRIEGGGDSGAYFPSYISASAGYFEAMGLPLIRGRFFNASDGVSSPQVAIISQLAANRVWPGEDPIGKRINYANMDGDPTFMTIVGVAGDVRVAPEAPATGEVYVHYLQRGFVGTFNVVVRSAGGTETLIPAVTSQIRSQNPNCHLEPTLNQMFSTNLANRRFNFTLLASFGVTALVLALLGVYGVTAYSVAQRKQEIGIRIALGAQGSDVTRLFLGEGSRLVMIGVAIGIAGAVAASRVLSSLLFNVQTTDVPTYLIAIIPMFGAAMLASHLPARRAAQVDPMVTIQHRD